jgi:hypothetical protein
MIFSLQSLTQTHLSSNINATVAAVPYLRALYSEDVLDAFEYRSLTLFDVNTRKRYEHEPNVAYAGYGLGLCHNYSSYEECDAAHPTERILSILYTRTALGVAFSKVGTAYYAYESSLFDIDLGFDERNRNPNEEYYWEAVRDKIRMPLIKNPYWRPVKRVLLMGESALNEKFNKILEEALRSVFKEMPPIYRDDPLFVVARGALEFVYLRLNDSDGAVTSNHVPALDILRDGQVEL